MKLTKKEKEEIIRKLETDDFLDDKYREILFKDKKEYELIYEGKEREVDILSDTMAVPLQEIKTFKSGKSKNEWNNMLIFGDNLQVLKTLLEMKEKGNLKNADGTDGVRLIYIDPPFATKQEFKGSQDQKAYQDKIAGAKFLEFIRKRLVFLRELLTYNGTIYIHLDSRKSHYIKIILDELFYGFDFSEIIWVCGLMGSGKFYPKAHEVIYCYKSKSAIFNPPKRLGYSERIIGALKKDSSGWYYTRGKESSGGSDYLKTYICTDPHLNKNEAIKDANKNRPQTAWSVWIGKEKLAKEFNDYPVGTYAYTKSENVGYPTQKPEALLARIINASSNKDDIILDTFAGSGTTLAAAEKLERRWIGIDCGKLSIYTIQKRFLNLRSNLGNTGSRIKHKSFIQYNAGLYDYKLIKELPWEEYRNFALKLFQCRDEKHSKYKIDFDGFLGSDSVIVFNYQRHKDTVMDRNYIDNLHSYLGDKIGLRMFIIAPAASVKFLEDYIQKGKTRYYILRIPYSIIEEIHKRDFKKLSQPMSESDVNDTIDTVGFDFIQTPKVECEYFIKKSKKGDLFSQKKKECVIKIKKFISNVLSKKPVELENLESLSMVMIDYDFNRKVFDLDEVFYADDIKSDDYEIRFDSDKIDKQMMIIYLDIFGNEKREIKTLKEFKNK